MKGWDILDFYKRENLRKEGVVNLEKWGMNLLTNYALIFWRINTFPVPIPFET